MEHIEFERRTDSRHLRTHIRYKIKEAFRKRDEELDRKRECLQSMLATEELQQEEEMANLFRTMVLENMQKRLDWIASAEFEKSEAEREFLKLKQIQRELINCEEMRPRESKKITEETKRIQLMQIAEKRKLQMKEKEIDKIWFEATICLEREKEKQQQYENHLKKIIANQNVNVLDSQLEYRKYMKELENEEKKEQNIINERARNEDAIQMDFEATQKLNKKLKEGVRQKIELQSKATEKLQKEKLNQFFEAKSNEMQTIQLKQEEEAFKMNKDLDQKTYGRCLQYAGYQKSEINSRNKMLDTALIAYGKRNESRPVNKIPYQKSVR